MKYTEKFSPTRIVEVEIGQTIHALSAFDEKVGRYYERAWCLVRLHTCPLGTVEISLAGGDISAAEYVQYIWNALEEQIISHLQQDGLPPVTRLDSAGIPTRDTPICIEAREQFLAHAPFVSVVVPTHDRLEKVTLCLRSLMALQYPHYEIIVVDNAPKTSATADFIQQTFQHVPQVRYVREDRQGSSWARTRGMLEARGEIIAYADDDVVVDSYWLVELVRAFNVADNVACVTCMVLPIELETLPQSWVEATGGFGKGYTQRIFDMAQHRQHTPFYPYKAADFGSGAGMAFTAAFLRSINGFDPALGANSLAYSCEDLAVFFQVVTRGYTLVYTPSALLYHHHYRDYAALRKQVYGYGVGMTAYLTKSIVDKPSLLFDLLVRIPRGLFFILRERPQKGNKEMCVYTKELNVLLRKGMFYGPFAYVRSRWAILFTQKTVSTLDAPLKSPMMEKV